MLEREEQAKLNTIRAAIDKLEAALRRFEVRIGRPLFVDEKERPRFKYPSPTSAIFQVLKAVRIVSALDAAAILIEAGHVTEMAVLFRTVDDFIGDITYLQEVHETGKVKPGQQKIIDQFFAEEVFDVDEMVKAGGKQPARASRQKVQASEARVLQPENPDQVQRIAATIDNTYSMYVHGGYPSIMEMYEGGDREGFRVRGMPTRIPPYRRELAHYTHRALNVFAGIAMVALGMPDLCDALVAARRELEASDAYQS